jgi:hypothetical protein
MARSRARVPEGGERRCTSCVASAGVRGQRERASTRRSFKLLQGERHTVNVVAWCRYEFDSRNSQFVRAYVSWYVAWLELEDSVGECRKMAD